MRQRTEYWARDLIKRTRSGKFAVANGSALQLIASHRDLHGQLLSVQTAAVELINVLRAIVAVARFIAFAGKALHEHPAARARIDSGDDAYLHAFVQEVRRTAPFFPIIGGRARETFEWQGFRFEKGAWVLLDLYGTDQDVNVWPEPQRFDPLRFLEREPTPFELVPQGAGDASLTHRCPGEDMTLEIMRVAVRELVGSMTFIVPAQDLSVDKSAIPALPASGVILANVVRCSPSDEASPTRASSARSI